MCYDLLTFNCGRMIKRKQLPCKREDATCLKGKLRVYDRCTTTCDGNGNHGPIPPGDDSVYIEPTKLPKMNDDTQKEGENGN